MRSSLKILTPLLALATLACSGTMPAQPASPPSQPAPAPAPAATPVAAAAAAPGLPAWQAPVGHTNDGVLIDMQAAFRRGDKARLTALLPQAMGHALEPWAAYWELKARLDTATPDEVQAFLARYAGSYQEDRLRNDWLLLAGKRRDWAAFAADYPRFRMRDDREVGCYAVAMDQLQGRPVGDAAVAEVRANWLAQRELDDGCLLAADALHQAGRLGWRELWLKARLAMEANRPALARAAVALDAPDAAADVAQIQASAVRYLTSRVAVVSRKRQELVALALVRLAGIDPDQAAAQMDGKWAAELAPEDRDWVWAAIGKQAQLKLSDQAPAYFAHVTRERHLSDDLLAWQARAALRFGQWRQVLAATEAMGPAARAEPVWAYWRARAQLALARSEGERSAARTLLARIAGPDGFYEQLAQQALGLPIVPAPPPAPLTEPEKEGARRHPGLNRALLAIAIGLRSEGVREWNYWTNLHTPGGMDDRQLYAAADFACQRQVWDRCINTSERTRAFSDWTQRYPMPMREAVLRQSRSVGIDPAYVYGLIRQESRFVVAARSGVGAAGLMQVMPATARWTARKIGLGGFTPEQIHDPDTNLLLGTSYLKLALDDFEGSLPLAAAAYNAGPGRPRAWRNGPVLEGAIWAENVPFAETRDYVKKVLANTVAYAAILGPQPPSLLQRLGRVGPLPAGQADPSRDMP